jgi:RNA polymerase sigma factor (sigma-70 family)
MVPRVNLGANPERNTGVASPYSLSAAERARRSLRGEMQREIVERARRGEHDAFAELAGAAITRLDSAAWLILRDPEQAADAVQNALVRAWRDLPTLRDPDRFDAWLHRLLVRSCIDEARRTRRHRVDVTIDRSPVSVSPGHETLIADRDQIERGFVRLDPELRAAIVLHHYLDLSVADVAATLGIPVGTAKSRIHRGLGLLRAALDADERATVAVSKGHPA